MRWNASVIVRARDEAKTIERTLRSLHAQSVRPEIIVVDSGSRDGTLDLARRWSDRLIEIDPGEFSYGRALNIGARAAQAPIHFALSAHCWPERDDWIARSLAHYERPEVAGTNGIETFADGRPVTAPFSQDAEHAHSDPFWGFSNHASSWRGEVWERFPFDEEIDYAEDREWSWRVLEAGWVLVFDPALWVSISHSWQGGVRDFFDRQRGARAAIASFAPVPDYGLGDLVDEWWNRPPADGRSKLFHRLNYRRMAGLLGKYAGQRQAERARLRP
jgi:rhamnosyltransferase